MECYCKNFVVWEHLAALLCSMYDCSANNMYHKNAALGFDMTIIIVKMLIGQSYVVIQ